MDLAKLWWQSDEFSDALNESQISVNGELKSKGSPFSTNLLVSFKKCFCSTMTWIPGQNTKNEKYNGLFWSFCIRGAWEWLYFANGNRSCPCLLCSESFFFWSKYCVVAQFQNVSLDKIQNSKSWSMIHSLT